MPPFFLDKFSSWVCSGRWRDEGICILGPVESTYAVITTHRDSRKAEDRQGPCKWNDLQSRTVGCFATVEKALEVVKNNWGDLNEAGYYPWLVIEEMPFGLHPMPVQAIWFHWDDGWQRIEDLPSELSELKTVISGSGIG